MNIDEFINAIFVRFPPDNINAYHTLEDAYGEYRNALRSDCTFDYAKALNSVIAEYEYKSAPSPSVLRGHLQKFKISTPARSYRMLNVWGDKDGRSYQFGVSWGETVEQTKKALAAQGFSNIRDCR